MSAGSPPVSVRISVPATSANLGPGFDTLGLALDLRDDLEVTIDRSGPASTDVQVVGEGAGELALDDSHLVVSTIRSVFDDLDFPQPGLRIRATNAIPHGQGLGSSAAAIVAGVTAALAFASSASGADGDTRANSVGEVDRGRVLELAAAFEGHPDNVAPCVLGGLTVAWCDSSGRGHGIELPVSGWLPVIVVPVDRLATHAARALLPATVDHAVAARNVARSALLIAVLTGQTDPAHILEATQDGLHQAFRASAMPSATEILADLRSAGIAAVVSGAGPSLLALVRSDEGVRTCRTIVAGRARVRPLSIDACGVMLTCQP